MAVRDGIVYALETGRLVALEAGDGHTRWEHAIETQRCPYHWQTPLLVLDAVVVVAAEDRLFVVDRGSGTRRHTISLGASFATMWGPPVLVETGEGQGRDLLSIDPMAGKVTARRRFRSGVYDVQVTDRVALVRSKSPSVMAVALPELSPLWSAAGFSGVGLVAGGTVLGRQVKDGDCFFEDVFPVDPASGRVGPRLFRRISASDRRKPPWDLEFIENDPGFSLRRKRPTDGQPLWETELPGQITAWRQAGGRFHAHCSSAGRGFLVTLDWAAGKLLDAAYGLRDVYGVDSSGQELFLLTREGVVAVSSHEFGPPEAATVPVGEAVRRILAAPIEGWNQAEALQDLEALGPEALPAITEELRQLAGWPLAVAASRLAAAGYREAAPALGQRLPLKDRSAVDNAVEIVLLDALAVLGGPMEVAATRSVLEAPGRDEAAFHAAMTLVTIGAPEGLESVERALETRRRRLRSSFAPPSAAPFLDLVGRPVDEAARNKAAEREDFVEWFRLGRGAECAKAMLPAGRALVVFPDRRLGNARDLWAQEVNDHGIVDGESLFLGSPAPGTPCAEGCAIDAEVQGSVLTLRRRGSSRGVVRVDLASARRDSDGDGLTDLVESRLGTDARRKDSDGDGIDDATDPFPRAPSHEPATEVEEVTAAVFEQFHLFGEEPSDLAVFVSEFALPASGRAGPMLTVRPKDLESFKARSGLDGAAFISIGPANTGGAAAAGQIAAFTGRPAGPAAGTDSRDRRYALTIYRGPLNAVGYEVVVRRTQRGWRVRYLRQAWVS